MQKLALVTLCGVLSVLSTIPNASVPDGYSAYIWADKLSGPRGIAVASTGEIVVLEGGADRITCLWDDNKDGKSDESERATIANFNGLNHAVKIYGGYLYASTSTLVLRWALTDDIRTPVSDPQVVVFNIPSGGHSSRTLEFDSNGRLYVTCGSGSNVDTSPARSLIKRFVLTSIPVSGLDFNSGTTFAIGMRNEVGLRFDKDGGLWGVENGVDDLNRQPWGDMHRDNPAEELNYFGTMDTAPGLFYGYPYCWSSYILPTGEPAGTQFAQPQFMTNYSDTWCQQTSNVVPPKLGLPAHTAPLDIIFYYGSTFPGINAGDAFVSLHGSWDRVPPQGYRIVRVAFQNGSPQSFDDFFYLQGSNQNVSESADWPFRPVGLAVTDCHIGECLLMTSDASGNIVSITSGIAPPDGSSSHGIVSCAPTLFAMVAILLSLLY